MDKETLSNYGWIVICILVLSVMIALATPFGNYVSNAVKSTATGLNDTSDKAMSVIGLNGKGEWDDSSNNGGGGNTPTTETKRDSGTLIPDGATYTKADGTTLEGNGTNKFPDTPAKNDKYEEEDYIYTYGETYSVSGWEVAVKDNTKTSYGQIISKIAGGDLVSMFDTFCYCYSLTVAPEIPSTVIDLTAAFAETAIVTAPVIPSNVKYMSNTFDTCWALTGTITINANPEKYNDCFYRTTNPIILTGSSTKLAEIAYSGNGNITVQQ